MKSREYMLPFTKYVLFVAAMTLAFVLLGAAPAHANEGPSRIFPDPNDTCHRDLKPTPTGCDTPRRLYLAVGEGEHISGETSAEIYGTSTGSITLRIEEAQHCQTYVAESYTHVNRTLDYGNQFKTQFEIFDGATTVRDVTVDECAYPNPVLNPVSLNDWYNRDYDITFSVEAGKTYRITATPLSADNAENLFRYRVIAGTGDALLGAGKAPVGGFSLALLDMPSDWGWTYGVHFGTDCESIPGSRLIQAYDADRGKYQNHDGWPELTYQIFYRVAGATDWTRVYASPQIALSGEGEIETWYDNVQPGYEYRIAIFNVSRPNALEILLPDTATQGTIGQACSNGEYDYIPSDPTFKITSPTDTGGVYYPGTSFDVNHSITNSSSATGEGPQYTRELRITQGSAYVTPSTNRISNNQPGLNAGESEDYSNNFTIASNTPHDQQICFQSYVAPGAGESPPSTDVSDANDASSEECITVYNLRYNITTLPSVTSGGSNTENGVTTTALLSPSSVLPGGTMEVDISICNSGNVPSGSTRGDAPDITTTITGSTNVTGSETATQNVSALGCASTIQFDGVVDASTGLGDTACVTVNVQYDRGYSDGYGVIGEQDRTYCLNIAEQAYVQIPNGSAWAGGNFDATPNAGYGSTWCTVPGGRTNGFIRSVIRGNQGAWAGFDVGATDTIAGFASGNTGVSVGGAIGGAIERLMFANASGTRGEFYANGNDGKCITDLWKYLSKDDSLSGVTAYDAASPAPTTGTGNHNFPGGANRQQQYYFEGQNLNIRDAVTINAGERITILVDGNVNIGANITYANYNVNDPNNIPILIIIARGDIRIASDVTELHGVYMARPNDGEIFNANPIAGQIDTCAYALNSATNPASPTSGADQGRLSSAVCRNQLRVRGMFVANDIEFRRTYGGVGGTNTNGGQAPAEIIQGHPEVYLANPFFVSTFEQNLPIDAFKDLPPVVN